MGFIRPLGKLNSPVSNCFVEFAYRQLFYRFVDSLVSYQYFTLRFLILMSYPAGV